MTMNEQYNSTTPSAGYTYLHSLSGRRSGSCSFKDELRGIAVDARGLIYAVGDQEVKILNSKGDLEAGFRTSKPGYGIAVDAEGMIWIGEVGQVEIYHRDGKRAAIWQDAFRLKVVTTIAFHEGDVLIGDAQSRCIRHYNRSGTWLNDIGADNNTKGFMLPNGHLDFAISADGTLHVINSGRHRVERFKPDGTRLNRVGRFGTKKPEDYPGCCNPTNIVLTPTGCTIVTQKAPPVAKVFDAEDNFLGIVDYSGFDPNCRNMDLAIGPDGLLYIVDTALLEIRVYQSPTAGPPPGEKGAVHQ